MSFRNRPNKLPRPRVVISNADKVKAVEMLAMGHGRAQVCKVLGMHVNTFRARLEEDVNFKRAVLDAEKCKGENVMYHVYQLALPAWEKEKNNEVLREAGEEFIPPVEMCDAETRLTAARVYLTQVAAKAERKLRARMKAADGGQRAATRMAMMMPRICDLLMEFVPDNRQREMISRFDNMIKELELLEDQDDFNDEPPPRHKAIEKQ